MNTPTRPATASDLGTVEVIGLSTPVVPAFYCVSSSNFDWHAPQLATTYSEALGLAKQRGFEARITFDGELVACWSPLYGATIYNRALAGSR